MIKKITISKAIISFFIICILFSPLAFSQSNNTDNSKEVKKTGRLIIAWEAYPEFKSVVSQDHATQEGKGLSYRLWEETKTSFTGWRLVGLTVGLAATGIAYKQDDDIRNWFIEQQPLGDASKYGEVIGQGYSHAAFDLGLYAFGKMLHNDKMVETSKALAEGLIINTLATYAIKYSVQRKRPNGDSKNSFPSAHTSGTFLTATVVSGMYDWNWKVMIPSYLLATFAGISRLEDDAHYASDVVFGAALGTVIGIAVSSYHKKEFNNKKLSIAPITGSYNGIMIQYCW